MVSLADVMRVCWVCCFGALVAATRVCLGFLLVAWRGVVGAVGVVVVWGEAAVFVLAGKGRYVWMCLGCCGMGWGWQWVVCVG